MSIARRRSSKMIIKQGGKSDLAARKKSITKIVKQGGDERVDDVPNHQLPDDLLDDIETDHFIYGMQDEMINKALQEIQLRRNKEEKVREFVQSFCNAWLKLVKWRWMVKDDKEKNIKFENTEPTSCPKDPWSAYSYEGLVEENPRSAVPPPRRCCPHPPLQLAENIAVERPSMEKLRRIRKRKHCFLGAAGPMADTSRSSMPRIKVGSQSTSFLKPAGMPKTAFPERANARIYMGPELAAKKKKGAPIKIHVSQVNINDNDPQTDDWNKQQSQQYSRLDL